jgi:malate synthase
MGGSKSRSDSSGGISIIATPSAGQDEILSGEALSFIADLTREFAPRIADLLEHRARRRDAWRAGKLLEFRSDTAAVREGDWSAAPIPSDLEKRVVEITGPVDRKMVINALNSGADAFMADFEDANSPTWDNLIQGQINLRDAVRGEIRHVDPASGKRYALNEEVATLLVRPRGLHLPERHCTLDGIPVPGSLFDFGLYLFHNARTLADRGSGPYFYLAKLESHTEARLWNDVFRRAQSALGLSQGTIRATVLIETLPAAFEMDEILYELREHSAGLNCGRWDYIFSFIKCHRWSPDDVLPDRSQVTMEQPFMRAYTQLAVRTCHRRGIHAMGGMAAQIPIKSDPDANRIALEKVRADKLREVNDGHDGTWVAHPGLVPIARGIFEGGMEGPNQLHRLREDVKVDSADLLRLPSGTRTEEGLRLNIRVGVQYLEAWLRGSGCVPLYHLMEDAATAEISRAQVWQWLQHGAELSDGRAVTRELVEQVMNEELDRARDEQGAARFEQGRFEDARELFTRLCFLDEMEEFLTSFAYDRL